MLAGCLLLEILCKSSSMFFLIAPREADAQLAHLARHGHVDFVYTVDQDLLVHGVPRIIFAPTEKTSSSVGWEGTVIMLHRRIERGDAQGLEALLFEHALPDSAQYKASKPLHWRIKLRVLRLYAAIVGNDYFPGVRGIGPQTAVSILQAVGARLALPDEEDTVADVVGQIWSRVSREVFEKVSSHAAP